MTFSPPFFTGHSNTPLRGGKLNWWEGGIRPAAFVWSPLLPKSAAGKTFAGIVHATDWLPTLLGLSGFNLALLDYPVDGVDFWPTLSNPTDNVTAHRSEALLAHNILRMGHYKLMAGAGDHQQAWGDGMLRDCVLGTGGGRLVPPNASQGTHGLCPMTIYDEHLTAPKAGLLSCTDVRKGLGGKEDAWLCSEPCTLDKPCLFNLTHDPGEKENIADANPDIVAHMAARLNAHRKTYWFPPMPASNGEYCEQVASTGWVQPWMGVPAATASDAHADSRATTGSVVDLVIDVATLPGCTNDGQRDCTIAFRNASRQIAANKGGTILLKEGLFLTGAFNLTDNATLLIQPDATILGVQSESGYPVLPPLPSYGTGREGEAGRYNALVLCAEASNVKIIGGGVIDGQGSYFWNRKNQMERPHLVEFLNCSDVEIGHVTLKDSAFWTLHPVYSSNVHIHHINIVAPANSPNTDGIDPDSSRNVLIEYANISCGDDFIAIKSGMNQPGRDFGMPSKNITVQYSQMWAGRGISIGSEVSGGIQDVFIKHNILHGPSEHGIHIKTSASRGGFVRNIIHINNSLGNVVGDALLGIKTDYGAASTYTGSRANGAPPAPTLTQIGDIV